MNFALDFCHQLVGLPELTRITIFGASMDHQVLKSAMILDDVDNRAIVQSVNFHLTNLHVGSVQTSFVSHVRRLEHRRVVHHSVALLVVLPLLLDRCGECATILRPYDSHFILLPYWRRGSQTGLDDKVVFMGNYLCLWVLLLETRLLSHRA